MIRTGIIVLCLLTLATGLHADEIGLKNGSRIVGTLDGMKGGVLRIKTDASPTGVIEVKYSEVVSILTEGKHELRLKDKSNIVGVPRPDDSGGLIVQTELSGEIPVKVEDVQGIDLKPKPPIRHKGNVIASAKIEDGNTREKEAQAQVYYEMRTDITRLTVQGDWEYNEVRSDLTERNARARAKYDHFFNDRVFGFGSARFEGDDFDDLNLRTTLTAGAGYEFLDKELDGVNAEFYEDLGIAFFDEDFMDAEDNRFTAVRLAGRLDWQIIKDRVTLFHFHEFYQGFEDPDDVFADARTQFRFTLVGNFFSTAQWDIEYDNTPAPGNRRVQSTYLFGLGYDFSYGYD